MDFRMKTGQREIVRIAMKLLSKQCEKAQKILNVLALSTIEVDALFWRATFVADATYGHVDAPVHLAFPLRATLRQGLSMMLEEVEGAQEGELKLGIDTDGSEAKAEEIKALQSLISEQTSLGEIIQTAVDLANSGVLDTDEMRVTATRG